MRQGKGNPMNKVFRLYENLTGVIGNLAGITAGLDEVSMVSLEFEEAICSLGLSFCQYAARPQISPASNGQSLLKSLGCRFVGSVVRLAGMERVYDVESLVKKI